MLLHTLQGTGQLPLPPKKLPAQKVISTEGEKLCGARLCPFFPHLCSEVEPVVTKGLLASTSCDLILLH